MSTTPEHTDKGGRPTLLTEDVEERLLAAVRVGSPVELSCQHAGISPSVFYKWMKLGREEHEAIADGEEPTEDYAAHLALFEGVTKARADAAVRNVTHVQKSAAGGYVTEEVTRKYRDPETGKIIEETTVKRASPDWRAAAWYLERSHQAHFSKAAEQVEVTGEGGGPVQVSVDARDLAKRLQEHIEAGVAQQPDVVEGSTVENDEPKQLEQ